MSCWPMEAGIDKCRLIFSSPSVTQKKSVSLEGSRKHSAAKDQTCVLARREAQGLVCFLGVLPGHNESKLFLLQCSINGQD